MRFTFSYILLVISVLLSVGQTREFRGAWLHTVFQAQYRRQTTDENKAYLIRQLDSLKLAGINAVIFQVRPQADAFYASEYEPWSVYLTDAGKAPVPFWDPLEFMVEECHARGMELHAWLNPYRVTSNSKQANTLPGTHIARKHPERCLSYGGKLYFDPGLPENREFIGKVVDDIVSRYDIDGIHFDDYFYPYPIAGKQFPDEKSYSRYGNGMKLADWRRHNVDLLIEDVGKRVKAVKPWVRFGISPFGIYRNKKTDPRGSETNGLENYDALYADVLLWDNECWIDYLLPQLYWELDHKSASYRVLVDWWNGVEPKHHIFVGQDVVRTSDKNELAEKIELVRAHDNIGGNCWWPGYEVTRNHGGVADSLSTIYHSSVALPPAYPWLSEKAPKAISGLRPTGESSFSWFKPDAEGKCSDTVKFGIYRFDSRADIDTSRPGALVEVTAANEYTAREGGVYVITAIDRVNNESEPSAPIIIR